MSSARQVGEYVLLSKDEFDKLSPWWYDRARRRKSRRKTQRRNKQVQGTTPTTRAVLSSKLFDHIRKMRKEGVINWNKNGQLLDAEKKELGSLSKLVAAALRPKDEGISSLPGYDWFVEALREYKIPKRVIPNKQLRGAFDEYTLSEMGYSDASPDPREYTKYVWGGVALWVGAFGLAYGLTYAILYGLNKLIS